MPYRLESKRRLLFDKNGKSPEWEGHFPLGVDVNGVMQYDTHKKLSEITAQLEWWKNNAPQTFQKYQFRVVVTTAHGDVRIITKIMNMNT